jgi:hypothetical protein
LGVYAPDDAAKIQILYLRENPYPSTACRREV